jgi:hypothetical protein
MLAIYDYRWYDDGGKFAFVQRRRDYIFSPYITYADEIFGTPNASDTNAIVLRYVKKRTAPSDEVTDLGVSRDLAIAIVHYVKYKFLEDNEDKAQRRWHYNRFLYYIQRHNRNIKGQPVLTKPDGPEVLK